MTPFAIEQQEGQFDFSLRRSIPGASPRDVKYATDLFTPATIERMAATWGVCWRASWPRRRAGSPTSLC